MKGNWLPRWEVSWKLTIDLGETSAKLTSDVRAAIDVKRRQVLAIGQDADVT